MQVVILRKISRNGGGNILSSFLLAAALVFGGVANVPVAVADDYEAFGYAIQEGDVEQVKHYINAGLELDKDSPDVADVFMRALNARHPEIIKILLAAGVNPDIRFNTGPTALESIVRGATHGKVFRENVKKENPIIEILLTAGANPNAEGGLVTALGAADGRLREQSEKVSQGRDAWIPRMERTKHIKSLLESVTPDPQYVATLRREHCEWLRDVRCEDNTPDETTAAVATEKPVATANDYQAFYSAINQEDVEQVKHYINAGLDLDKRIGGNPSALERATDANHVEIVEMLLAAGANPSATENGGSYALSNAINKGNASIGKMLLAAGVKPDVKGCFENQTCLSFAKENLAWVIGLTEFQHVDPDFIKQKEQLLSAMESATADPQYIANLRREHCEWLRDVRCEDDTPDETTAAVATEETDYGVLYGSVAWRETPTHIHWYWVLNAADEGEANTDVGNYCDADVGNTTDCKLAGAFNNGCGAIAVSDEDIVFYATEASTFSARRAAIGFCDKNGGTKCKAVDSVCTADVEDKEAAAKAKQEKESGSVAK